MNRRVMTLIVSSLLLPLGCGGNDGPGNDGPTGPSIATLVVTTTSLPNAAPTVAYSQTLLATGGDGSYMWSVTVGSLPTGMSLNSSTGDISGTPTGASTTFTLQVASGDGQTATQALTITVNATLAVGTTTLPDGGVGLVYATHMLGATGGDGTYTWTVSTGSLPPGLNLSASRDITGTPTATGTSDFTVRVTSGDGQTATQALTITVNATLAVGTTTLPDGGVGLVYATHMLGATGGDGTYTWTVSTGSLPPGLNLSASRDITGTPTATGTSDFTVRVTSGDGQTATQQLMITVTSLDPPFSGTIFLDSDIITSLDPTSFQNLSFAGQGSRMMFDRRVNDFITVDAYLFDATFDDGLVAEIQVNPEFGGSAAALAEAEKYAEVIGRLPTALRNDVQFVWIHKGVQPFGGGNNSLLIHTGQADLYTVDGILEETFVHEAAHTSLDAAHASAPAWLAAQSADGMFITTYARDFPIREDIAESFLLYLAIRYRSGRISPSLETTILQTMPNRIAYFDNQSLDIHPIN